MNGPTDEPANRQPGELTYPDVGSTRKNHCPPGFRPLQVRVLLGHGPEVQRAAGNAVLTWRMHRAVGVTITADAPVAAPGVRVVVGLAAGPLRIEAPCLVVWTVTEERRTGFAYGTLPGHPECGEESFVVETAADGGVRLTVTAFSRPAAWWARAAGPLARALQRAYARRCGKVLRRLATSAD
ncbi:DUF1990 domain-containing protein [Streptomyces sannanensis]|uniref:DUF1990 domain-containing protein n=1 Tax=Streptomyces sannanensis TaxID=285536 RepID=A0ABP6S7V8_9ACTN